MVEFTEKREYFRINVDCEMDYRLRDSNEIQQARCTTLSGAGLPFITSQALTIAAELEIIIQSQLALTPPLRAHVKVINVRGLADNTFLIHASMTVLHDD